MLIQSDLNYFVRKCKSYRNKDEGHITFECKQCRLFKLIFINYKDFNELLLDTRKQNLYRINAFACLISL